MEQIKALVAETMKFDPVLFADLPAARARLTTELREGVSELDRLEDRARFLAVDLSEHDAMMTDRRAQISLGMQRALSVEHGTLSAACELADVKRATDIVKKASSWTGKRQALVCEANADGYTPLMIAAQTGCLELVQLLLDEGAEPFDRCQIPHLLDDTAVHFAAKEGHVDVLAALSRHWTKAIQKTAKQQQKGEDKAAMEQRLMLRFIHAKGFNGRTPLSWAVRYRRVAVVEWLLENGARADGHRLDSTTTTTTTTSSSTSSAKESGGASGAAKGEDRPLHIAAKNGDVALTRLLLDFGANPFAKDESGRTPLFIAAETASINLVRFYRDRGVSLSRSELQSLVEKAKTVFQRALDSAQSSGGSSTAISMTRLADGVEAASAANAVLSLQALGDVTASAGNLAPGPLPAAVMDMRNRNIASGDEAASEEVRNGWLRSMSLQQGQQASKMVTCLKSVLDDAESTLAEPLVTIRTLHGLQRQHQRGLSVGGRRRLSLESRNKQ